MISNGRRQRQHGRLGPQRGSSDAGDLGGFPRPTGASLHAHAEQSNRDLKHLTRQTLAARPARPAASPDTPQRPPTSVSPFTEFAPEPAKWATATSTWPLTTVVVPAG